MIKKYISTICLSLCLAFTTSCEDSLLTQVNPNTVTDGSFWQTELDFEKALNAMYGALQLHSISGKDITYDIMRSDLGGTESWYGPMIMFGQLKWTDGTDYVNSRWSQLYTGIFRANQILYYIETTDCLTAEDKEQVIAQAKFLRGYCYFWLMQTYNGAVIHDQLVTNPDDMHKPFSERAEVLELVISDFEAALILPKTYEKSELGHFTWGAAVAMLGKTYIFEKDYTKAKEYFKMIIDAADETNLYSLVSNYMDNFTVDNEFNSESILEVSYSDVYKDGSNPNYNSGLEQDGVNGSESNSIAMSFATLNAGGYNNVMPSYHIHEMFVAGEEMDPNNSWTASHVRSMRTYASIVVEFGDGDYYGSPLTPYTDDTGKLIASKTNFNYGQGAKVKKYTQWDRVEAEDQSLGCRTGINYRAIRYADILLLYAECLLETGGSLDEAISYIDKVRTRAGVITLASYIADNGGKIPVLHVSNFANNYDDFQYVTADKTSVLTHLRMVERPLELAFEGHRWYDLVRWGLAKETFDLCYSEELKLCINLCGSADVSTIPSGDKVYPLYLNERVRPDCRVKSENYQSSVHDYFAIPTDETQNNKLL